MDWYTTVSENDKKTRSAKKKPDVNGRSYFGYDSSPWSQLTCGDGRVRRIPIPHSWASRPAEPVSRRVGEAQWHCRGRGVANGTAVAGILRCKGGRYPPSKRAFGGLAESIGSEVAARQ